MYSSSSRSQYYWFYVRVRVALKYEKFLCEFTFFAMKTEKWVPKSFDVDNYVIIMAHVM